MDSRIPDPLASRNLIRIYSPDSDVEHPGKQPKDNARDGPFWSRGESTLQDWIDNGGNVGVALVDDLVVIDVDDLDRYLTLVSDAGISLPESFSVQSGGGGRHYYYRCKEWTENVTRTENGSEIFSIRTDGWQVVIPPSRHPSGGFYETAQNREIASVSINKLSDLESLLKEEPPTHGGGPGGSAAAPPRVGSPIPSIPSDYPSREASVGTCKSWVDGNDLANRFSRLAEDQSGDDWLLCKCMAEGGFALDVIIQTMDRFRTDQAKWHRRDEEYRLRTVHKAIEAAVEDEYVDFSDTADMDAEASERRKTDTEDHESSVNKEVSFEMSATYNDHEEVTILEGTEDGDNFKKVVRTTREEDGETVEYVSIKSGRVELVETVDGDEVLAQRVTDSTSIGSPEYITELADALQELDTKINGED